MEKIYIPEGETPCPSQIGATLEALAGTIENRRTAGPESYTNRLLTGKLDDVLKKVMEESGEVALGAKDTFYAQASGDEAEADAQVDHLRYEAADVVYHLLVVLARFNISLDEFAAELNARMRADERPVGGVCLKQDHIKRGK